MAKREPIRLPGNFDEALSDLLKVKPPSVEMLKHKKKKSKKAPSRKQKGE